MRYVIGTLNIDGREMAYRFYISEGIRILTENTAMQVAGRQFTSSFSDILKPQKVETRTPEQIIDKIKNGLDEL